MGKTTKPPVDLSRCKFCKKKFDKDPSPTVSNPGPEDVLRRRTVGSKDCRPCFSFIRNEPSYSEMSSDALAKSLENPQAQAEYDRKFDGWCETRRTGGRRLRNGGAERGEKT